MPSLRLYGSTRLYGVVWRGKYSESAGGVHALSCLVLKRIARFISQKEKEGGKELIHCGDEEMAALLVPM
jgi:hypothetical protein